MTRDDILNHDITPLNGWLRLVDRPTETQHPHPLLVRDDGQRELVLQRYNSDRGVWQDVPAFTSEELALIGRL